MDFGWIRSSHRRCSLKKGVPKNFAKFTGKHLYQSFFFNKVAGLRPATLSEKRLWRRCFPVNIAKLLKTLFLQNTSGRLLLLNIKIYSPEVSNIQRREADLNIIPPKVNKFYIPPKSIQYLPYYILPLKNEQIEKISVQFKYIYKYLYFHKCACLIT